MSERERQTVWKRRRRSARSSALTPPSVLGAMAYWPSSQTRAMVVNETTVPSVYPCQVW